MTDERDPLVDPRPGDVVRANGYGAREVAEKYQTPRGEFVAYHPWKNGVRLASMWSCALVDWRDWCRDHAATVVRRGEGQ